MEEQKDAIMLQDFLKQKLNNFILYLEKTIGVNNKLYPQVKQLQGNELALINYAEYLVKAAKLTLESSSSRSFSQGEKEKNGGEKKIKYTFEDNIIIEYLEKNGLKKEDLMKLDNGGFLLKLKRYLELFVNTIC